MKIILTTLLGFLCFHFFSQDRTQFIAYNVPIHLSTKIDEFETVIGSYQDFPEGYEDSIALRRLNNNARIEMVTTIFEKIKNGEVTAYVNDEYFGYGEPGLETPDRFFKTPIAVDELEDYMGEFLHVPIYDDNGDLVYDENGGNVFAEEYQPYLPEDVVSLTFYEEWTVSANTNKISKKTLGYGINVLYYEFDEYDIYYAYEKPLFYIPCTEFKTKGKTLVKNIESITRIRQSAYDETLDLNYEDALDQAWWFESLLPDTRVNFLIANDHAPFCSANSPLKLYASETGLDTDNVDPLGDFPLKLELSIDGAKEVSRESVTIPKFDYNGDNMYEGNGEPVYMDSIMDYTVFDIEFIGFIEEWYFDEATLSINKKVKAIAPVSLKYDYDSGVAVGIKKLFYIRYE